MKVNWKHLATTSGYRSLKAALIKDLQSQRSRSKKEYYDLFYKVIGNAISHAHHTGQPVESFLDEWEANRSYWWVNYYSNHKFRHKPNYIPPPSTDTWSIRTWKRHFRKWYNQKEAQHRICRLISERGINPARAAKYRRKISRRIAHVRK